MQRRGLVVTHCHHFILCRQYRERVFLAGNLSTMGGAQISIRDAYIMEILFTWCGTAACANTCMCLLTRFKEKMAFE